MATSIVRNVCTCARNFRRISGLLVARKPVITTELGVRHHARWFAPYLHALRRQINSIKSRYGPEEQKPRSHQENWDYESELYAFGKRLGEDFNDATLRVALTDRSYLEMEEARREEMGLTGDSAKLEMSDNKELAQTGLVFISDYIKSYLRHVYPRLPEDGISAIHEFLARHEVFEHVGRNLGLRDAILCAAFPIPMEVTSTAFQAVVGAIRHDSGAEKAGLFVRDFVISQLVDKDLNELWHIGNPMGILADIIESEGRAPPEARLLRQTGSSTIMPLYMVGVYSDKKLLGWGPGETLAIAEEEAARAALKHIFGTTENRPPLPLDSTKHAHLNEVVCAEVTSARLTSQASFSS
ncbi:large ribosomal subunit protein mL44-like [Asterias amurensis]|uniref:large ribosomal subunit protein mL44-like n=1 Tax=Asterias amurensis TaxID=7602 RepID=UPI003AB51F80